MTIVGAPPPQGRRELICHGDEARVSRFRTSRGVLVERYQDDRRSIDSNHHFSLPFTSIHERYLVRGIRRYHLIKYQALRLAAVLFPDNFVRAERLHVNGRRYWMYSRHVPDENGAMGRVQDARRRYRASKDDAEREGIRSESDVTERRLNPELRPLAFKLAVLGITVAHPEANYHVSAGKTVFFEIEGLDLMRVIAYMDGMEGMGEALSHVSMLLACQAKLLALALIRNSNMANPLLSSSYRSYADMPVGEVFAIMRSFLSDDEVLLYPFREGLMEFIKVPAYDRLYALSAYGRRMEPPYHVDDSVLRPSGPENP